MTEETELQDSQTPEEVPETPETPAEPSQDLDELTKKANVSSQNYERAKKAEAEVAKLRETLSAALTEEKEDKPAEEKAADPLDQVAEALSVIRDLKENELNALRDEARSLGISQADFIKSKPGKAYLEVFRHEQEVARTTPPPTAKGVGTENVSTDKPSRFPTVAEWKADKAKQRGNE